MPPVGSTLAPVGAVLPLMSVVVRVVTPPAFWTVGGPLQQLQVVGVLEPLKLDQLLLPDHPQWQ